MKLEKQIYFTDYFQSSNRLTYFIELRVAILNHFSRGHKHILIGGLKAASQNYFGVFRSIT